MGGVGHLARADGDADMSGQAGDELAGVEAREVPGLELVEGDEQSRIDWAIAPNADAWSARLETTSSSASIAAAVSLPARNGLMCSSMTGG